MKFITLNLKDTEMINTINNSDFHDAFIKYNRCDNFSYEARDLLFDHFEAYEDDSGTQIELDVISICCDYKEDSIANIAENYSIEIEGLGDSEIDNAVRAYLECHTALIGSTEIGLV
jgi:hypothetical protein